jgi:hypothetical protein
MSTSRIFLPLGPEISVSVNPRLTPLGGLSLRAGCELDSCAPSELSQGCYRVAKFELKSLGSEGFSSVDSQLFPCVGTEALRGPGRGPHHIYIYVADAGELLDS